MKYFFWLFATIIYLSPHSLIAQAAHDCGTDHDTHLQLAESIVKLRQAISEEEILFLKNSRNITYIPVSFHLVADTNGLNKPNLDIPHIALCMLNNDFRPYNIQFYFHYTLPIRIYKSNQAFYEDAYANYPSRINNQTSYALNIYIGKNASRTAGFYVYSGDYIFVRDRYVFNPQNPTNIYKTLTHEVGHFLGLTHTFAPWSNINYDSVYANRNAPTIFNSRPVENKARSGSQKNCDNSGDFLCDTPADYYSQRNYCTFIPTGKDPYGETISPDKSNYMSYFNDDCMSSFTAHQVDVMFRNIIDRGWHNRAPVNYPNISGNYIHHLSPINNDTLIVYNQLNLRWAHLQGASHFILQLFEIIDDSTSLLIHENFVSNSSIQLFDNNYTVNIPRNGKYKWSLQAVSQTGCMTMNADDIYFIAQVQEAPSVAIHELNTELPFNIKIYPNPIIEGTPITLNITAQYNTRAKLKIYTIDGRLIGIENIYLQAQENHITLQYTTLNTGIYIVQLESKVAMVQSKFIVL